MFNITTTWGDKHYVGLTGIEIFSSTGEPVTVEKVCVITGVNVSTDVVSPVKPVIYGHLKFNGALAIKARWLPNRY